MEDAIGSQARPKQQSRACEACRVAKIRCQAGIQPGICKRCFEFKRECVFRTGPRTRRAKAAKGDPDLPPPPGPSQTFNIDFSMALPEEPTVGLNQLLQQHEQYMDALMPSSEEEDGQDVSSKSSFNFASLPTPVSTAGSATKPVIDLGIRPSFNLDSADRLLEKFRSMVQFCPMILLEKNDTVQSMAKGSPFVLLAILAATSCSSSLQSHSLYDEEFRKVLGVKFVAGGERTLEMLQGILIYCAWYPSHLRPKQRRVQQYLKMASDIIIELELDQEKTVIGQSETEITPQAFAGIRAYVSCYYQTTMVNNAFSRKTITSPAAWITKCCDLLEEKSSLEQDHVLSWIIRLHHIADQMYTVQRGGKNDNPQNKHRRGLIRIGLETQLRDWQCRIPTNIILSPNVSIASFYDDMYLAAAPLMMPQMPRPSETEVPLDPSRLMDTVHTLKSFFEIIVSLPWEQISCFCNADWGHLIIVIILAFRLSLPLELCPEFDAAQARQVFNFDMYLERLCEEPEQSTDTMRQGFDCCTAFRVILRSLKAKFSRKVAAAEAREQIAKKSRECPMFDGSIDEYLDLWDGHGGQPVDSAYATSQSDVSGSRAETLATLTSVSDQEKPQYHDLWATMTLGWAGEELPPIEQTGLDYGDLQDYHGSHGH